MSSVNEILDQLKNQLEKNLIHTTAEFKRIRAGKATPDMLEGVFVDYYGASTPINQAANVNTPDARTIVIQPWDKSLIRPIETAIINSNLGLRPKTTANKSASACLPLPKSDVKNWQKDPKPNLKALK